MNCLRLHWQPTLVRLVEANLQKVELAFKLTLLARERVGLSANWQVPLKNLEGMTSAAIPKLKKMMRKMRTSIWKTQIRHPLLFFSP